MPSPPMAPTFSFNFWALGRAADPVVLKQEGGCDLVVPTPIPLGNGSASGDGELVVPRELTATELRE
jgi:hypothetical protein